MRSLDKALSEVYRMTTVYDPVPNEVVNDIRASALVEATEGSSLLSDSLTGLEPAAAGVAPPAGPGRFVGSALAPPKVTGGHVNRFLLCVLATKSAKEIKEKAQVAGQDLLITTIVKQVLTSYRQAEDEAPGLLSGPGSHLGRLHRLNKKVLNEQINGCAREKVRDSQRRFDSATRQGDEGRIKSEKETLARDIAECERIAGKFR